MRPGGWEVLVLPWVSENRRPTPSLWWSLANAGGWERNRQQEQQGAAHLRLRPPLEFPPRPVLGL